MESIAQQLVKSMDDQALKQYHSRHLRDIAILEHRVKCLQELLAEEIHEMELRGLND